MEEKLITKKNGMLVLIVVSLLYLLALPYFIMAVNFGGFFGYGAQQVIIALGILWLCVGWIPFLGLKVVKPQEALVLTLFGKYYGTIREDGFYFVNPFCTAINPASGTKLNQSGDVQTEKKSFVNIISGKNADEMAQAKEGKKISLSVKALEEPSEEEVADAE